jgi:hypothetical protein
MNWGRAPTIVRIRIWVKVKVVVKVEREVFGRGRFLAPYTPRRLRPDSAAYRER